MTDITSNWMTGSIFLSHTVKPGFMQINPVNGIIYLHHQPRNPMNLRTFQNLLATGQPVNIEIIKNAQIYGHHVENMFLTNRSNHYLCPYPMLPDPTSHLNPGDILQVLEVHEPNTKHGPSCIMVENDNHKPFYIFQPDWKRFIKINP